MSKCSASWAIVRSPLTAARATFALKAGEWFRRGRLLMVSPVHGDYRRCQAEIPLIILFRFPEPALISRSCAPAAIGLNVRERVNGSIFDKISRAAKRYHADPAAK